jgi:hypothetical protein
MAGALAKRRKGTTLAPLCDCRCRIRSTRGSAGGSAAGTVSRTASRGSSTVSANKSSARGSPCRTPRCDRTAHNVQVSRGAVGPCHHRQELRRALAHRGEEGAAVEGAGGRWATGPTRHATRQCPWPAAAHLDKSFERGREPLDPRSGLG